MALLGLGVNKKPFIYLDSHVKAPDWTKLHAEVCLGIAKSEWNKKFVSSGVHKDWANVEITPYMGNAEVNLDPYAKQMFYRCTTTDERIKFMTAYGPVPHPFWGLFIRNNKRIERTGILNKSVGADCEWTDNAKFFPTLVEYIKTMPFSEIGRVILFMTEAKNETVPHFDGKTQDERPNDDFIWFTTKPGTKNIFVMDEESKVRTYADGVHRFVWFNEMDYHGTEPVGHFSFSVRIDGKFTPELKNKLINEQ